MRRKTALPWPHKLCVLLLPAQVLGQVLVTPPEVTDPQGSYTHGQKACFAQMVTNNTGAPTGDISIKTRRSANAVYDSSDPLIDSWIASGIGAGQFVELLSCNKFCQDGQSSGIAYICVEVAIAGSTYQTCIAVPINCVHSSDTGPAVADKQQAGNTAEPISTLTGAFFNQFPVDLNLGGPMPLRFSRYYSSGYIETARHASALGTNWRHNFDWHLQRVSPGQVEVTDNQGRLITFTSADAGATWTLSDPLDIPYQLAPGAANEYILGHPLSNLTYTFYVDPNQIASQLDDKPHGLLTLIKEAQGNVHTLTYTDRLLTTVTDGLGRTLTFAYNVSGLLASVTDDQARAMVFTHGGGNLRELLTSKDPLLNVTTYSYDGTHILPGLMTSYQRAGSNTPVSQTYQAGTGKVLTQTTAGHTITLAYAGSLTTVTDPVSNTLQHTHSASGELTGITNQSGSSVSMSYNGSTKRRTGVTDTLGATTGYSYHAGSGRPASITHANGQITSFSYTARAEGSINQYDRTRVTHPDGTTDLATFDANGNVTTRTDRAGFVTTYTHNARGQILTTTHPETGINTWTYSADGTTATYEDAFNNTTTFGYDSKRRRNLITYADGSTRAFIYDNNNRLTSDTDQRGHATMYTYDTNNNLASVTDREGNVTTYTYDALDRVIDIQDSSVGGTPSTVNTYDTLERLKDVTDRNGNKTAFSYDAQSRLIKVTDPLLEQWQFSYDYEGIIASTTDPLGQSNSFTSDVMGRTTQARNALSNTRSSVYDSMGRVTSFTDPLGKADTWGYSARGLVSTRGLPDSISASYTRNALGQITRVTDPRGQFWDRAYTKGRLNSRTDPLGRSTSFIYDNMHRRSVVTFPSALGTLTNTYDANGSPTRRLYSGGGPELNFSYDDMDRLLTANGVVLVRDTLGRITRSNGIDVTYDTGGRLTSVDMDVGGSSKTVLYAYDANDRLTTITDWAGGSTTFTYDNAGRMLTITRPNGIVSTYSYDQADQILSITESKAGTLSAHTLARDAAGQVSTATRNILTGPTQTVATTLRSFDAAAQIQGYSYDGLGRLTNTNAGTTRSWDLASRLSSSTTGAVTTTYTYDGLGQRLSKNVEGGTSRNYVWNQALGLPSVAIEKEAGTDLRYYIHTPDGRLLHAVDASDNTRHFYHYDEMGNTQFVSNNAGTAEVSYHHSPYGNLLGQTGNLDNPFTWQGAWGVMDDGEGQFYARARYYDADSQRFISKDPVVSIDPRKISPYQYAVGNPLMFSDPNGLDPAPTVDEREFRQEVLKQRNRLTEKILERGLRGEQMTNFELWQELAGSWDSKYANLRKGDKFEKVWFRGRLIVRAEINYYFQGMLASALGLPYAMMPPVIYAWKALNYGGLPSSDEIWATREGYDSWQEDVDQAASESSNRTNKPPSNTKSISGAIDGMSLSEFLPFWGPGHETTRERYDREKQEWKEQQKSRMEEFNRGFGRQ